MKREKKREEKYKHDAGIFNQLSNDSFSIEQKALGEQIELHIGAIQSRVRIRFIHETVKQQMEKKINEIHSGLFFSPFGRYIYSFWIGTKMRRYKRQARS